MLKLTLLATALIMLGAVLVPSHEAAAQPPSGIYRIPGSTPGLLPGGHLIDPCYNATACGGSSQPHPLPPIGRGTTPHCGGVEKCLAIPAPGQIRPLIAD
jgi:hypothetical protein